MSGVSFFHTVILNANYQSSCFDFSRKNPLGLYVALADGAATGTMYIDDGERR